MDSINANKIKYESLSLRAKIYTNSTDIPIKNLGLNVRIKKDSLIWIAISAKGIAGLRILLKPDSIHIMDKINKRRYLFEIISIRFCVNVLNEISI